MWLSTTYWYFTLAFIILFVLQKRSFRISIQIPENNSLKDARWVYLPGELAAFEVFSIR